MRLELAFLRQTANAVQFHIGPGKNVWIPKSIMQHDDKENRCFAEIDIMELTEIVVPDWFVEQEGLEYHSIGDD